MITPYLSSSRDDSASAAEVKTRRARAAAAGRETYGAENLPVLIRLPDLTTTEEPVVVIPVPVVSDEAATKADAPRDCVQDSRPIPPPCEPMPTGEIGAESSTRANRRTRRGVPRPTPARPSGGVGQFLFAVVLAGVLFAIIVTIKEWNQAPPTKTPPTGHEQVGAPEINLDQPEQAPAANAFSDQPELVPAANAFSNKPDVPMDTALESDEPVAPEAAGYADGAEQEMGSYDSYPSTGVGAVQPQPVSAGSAANAAWPPAVDNSPIRNADRSSPDARYQQR